MVIYIFFSLRNGLAGQEEIPFFLAMQSASVQHWYFWEAISLISFYKDLGRVSSEDEKRICSCETRSQCDHILKNINFPAREWVSLWTEQVSVAKQSAAERVSGVSVRVNEHSEWLSGLLVKNAIVCN